MLARVKKKATDEQPRRRWNWRKTPSVRVSFRGPRMKALVIVLILVPAPRAPAPFPVGDWIAQWSGITQQMHFHPDGRYESREFGNGFWSMDSDGYIHFSERNNETHYVMLLDPRGGTGTGWRYSDCGEAASPVKVRLKRK